MNNISTEEIYDKVKNKLKLLYKVSENNEKIIKLAKTIDYFHKDKDWLLIIENGLDKINSSINIINSKWNNSLTNMIDKILNSVK